MGDKSYRESDLPSDITLLRDRLHAAETERDYLRDVVKWTKLAGNVLRPVGAFLALLVGVVGFCGTVWWLADQDDQACTESCAVLGAELGQMMTPPGKRDRNEACFCIEAGRGSYPLLREED